MDYAEVMNCNDAVRTHLFLHIYVYFYIIYTCAGRYVCMYVCMYACLRMCLCTCICTCMCECTSKERGGEGQANPGFGVRSLGFPASPVLFYSPSRRKKHCK